MKINLTVVKKFTLNTGNFSSVAPSIAVGGTDIEPKDIKEAYENLEIVADALMHKQMESDVTTMATVKKMGFEKYFKAVDKDAMDQALQDSMDKLENM